jgi:phosphomannomutase
MIPWLLVAELLSTGGQPLSALVQDRIDRYPISGEINRTVPDIDATLAQIKDRYGKEALTIDEMDGLSFAFADWRFNLRASNTEPVVRLNVETRANPALLAAKTDEILALLG